MNTATTAATPTAVASNFAVPLAITVPLRDGQSLVITAANVETLLKLKAMLLPVLQTLAEESPAVFSSDRLKTMLDTGMVTARDITELCGLLDQADVVVDVTALLSGLPRNDLVKLLPDEFATLFSVGVMVNADFFAQALPAFKAAAQRLAGVGRPERPAAAASGTNSSPRPSTA